MIFLKNNPHKPRTAEQALKPSLRGPDNYPKSPRSPCQGQDTAFQPQALLLADLPGARDRAGGQRDSSASWQCGWTPPWHPALRSPQPRARPAVRGRAGRRGGGGGGEEGGEGGRSRLTSPFPLPGFLCSISMLEVPTELRSEDLLGCAGPSSFLCASRSPVQAVPHRPGRHVPAASPPSRAPPGLGGRRKPPLWARRAGTAARHRLPRRATSSFPARLRHRGRIPTRIPARIPASIPLRGSEAPGPPSADAARLPGPLVLNAERRQDGGVSERGRGALVRPAGPGAG